MMKTRLLCTRDYIYKRKKNARLTGVVVMVVEVVLVLVVVSLRLLRVEKSINGNAREGPNSYYKIDTIPYFFIFDKSIRGGARMLPRRE